MQQVSANTCLRWGGILLCLASSLALLTAVCASCANEGWAFYYPAVHGILSISGVFLSVLLVALNGIPRLRGKGSDALVLLVALSLGPFVALSTTREGGSCILCLLFWSGIALQSFAVAMAEGNLAKYAIPVLASSLALGLALVHTSGGRTLAQGWIGQLPRLSRGLPDGSKWPPELALGDRSQALVVTNCKPCSAAWLKSLDARFLSASADLVVFATDPNETRKYFGTEYELTTIRLQDLSALRLSANDPPQVVLVQDGRIVYFESAQEYLRKRKQK